MVVTLFPVRVAPVLSHGWGCGSGSGAVSGGVYWIELFGVGFAIELIKRSLFSPSF